MILVDSDHRSQATDPSLSFIVQAPAGSGKTEILTQRYLRLLSTVTAPEQIIALTFTRKAAREMRERILLALQHAAANHQAQSPHQQMTLDLAQQALNRSKQYHWDLLLQPNRLKVITLDSLCQSISQAIPLLEQHIAYPNINEKPAACYLKAARRCLQFAIDTAAYQPAIKTLLLHVDNKQEHLLGLFKTLLAQREQWLSSLFQARTQEKSTFEAALRQIEQHELTRLQQSLPGSLAMELTRLSQELALVENDPESPRYILKNWDNFQKINPDIAKALCKTLLTAEHSFRKQFDHHCGLKKGLCSPLQYQRLKLESQELLSELVNYPDFLNILLQVSQLPEPEYNQEQWEVLQALFILLPLLVAHLHIFFSEHNEVDFTTISQQALAALGDEDHPTDLALYLDNSIQHLLVDEFQDTSITQFELLTKLVHGWQPGDGRTLFIVGDPMQSIYRFRQAEVGLFFRAKEQGIGSIKLKSLELRCNFRSTEAIIQWINSQFIHIFPQTSDMESGAVSFHPSVHLLKNNEATAIQALQFKNKEQEAKALITLINEQLHTNPDHTLAILVRSRSQLIEIINLLRQHKIPYQGTDIDLLSNLMHLRDVWSLSQALLYPSNRLAWLALLRSPYCGLLLQDIHLIAQFNPKKSIYDALLHLDAIQGITEEGRIRARFFLKIMHQSLTQRYQNRLSEWLIQTLKNLHGDHLLTPAQLGDLEQFWTLLDRYEQDGRLADRKEFLEELNKLYSQQTTPSRLQIMTIHKSKGLEFDTVFLPGLGAQPSRGENPLLRWLKLPTQNQQNLLLVSPIQAAHQDHCALYHYLKQLDEEKSFYETQRLLYVAVTRAKSQLFLMDGSTKSSKNSLRNLLKNQEFYEVEAEETPETVSSPRPKLTRLPLHFFQKNPSEASPFLNTIDFKLATGIPRLIGIVTHQLLHWICEYHPQSLEQIPWELANKEFKKLGFDRRLQQSALSALQEQIMRLFQDERGSWIIARHDKEFNEYELLVESQNTMATRIIDRTFEENKKQWIIDFKTGKEELNTLKQHQQQLNEYAHYLSRQSELPLHCGLYYLHNNRWISWEYEAMLIS